MNLAPALSVSLRLLLQVGTALRRLMPTQRSRTFGPSGMVDRPIVEGIYVINLDRRPDRWAEMQRELRLVADAHGTPLAEMATRCSAVDARDIAEFALEGEEVYPYYTLADQLQVEPQPSALPDRIELDRPISMTPQEVAVALSHVNVWRRIAAGEQEYGLVLEDDAWFRVGFARQMDQAWGELTEHNEETELFDLLYLSYKEVKNGAQKALLSESIFRPVRGLWYMSGYVLSRRGARRLLKLLPCCGPVDLWINHQFERLAVRATRRPIIAQRLDGDSTNSYSVLPVLNRIGAIDSEGASLFQIRPTEMPVFVFGSKCSGMSSVAMALSILGYRCCSDLETLPICEYNRLMAGSADRVFDAYVNIGSLTGKAQELRKLFPGAKFIVTIEQGEDMGDVMGGTAATSESVAVLRTGEVNKWRILCEHLRCAPPVCPFPRLLDTGQRKTIDRSQDSAGLPTTSSLKRDTSPWVIERRWDWEGITVAPSRRMQRAIEYLSRVRDSLDDFDHKCWFRRNDTFPGNLALFRPENVEILPGGGAMLTVREEDVGVRSYSAAAISSCKQYLFGRFEAVIRASNVPGVVTGFFLHRDSPRQEIDVEIPGNRPDCLLVNVFYNPGDEGVRFDYGYRGAPSCVRLGFNASRSVHRFAIEWEIGEIRWLVDDRLVHRRVNWDPTPIPHLPMTLHINAWPSRSKDLAGGLKRRLLPASVLVKSTSLDAGLPEARGVHGSGLHSFGGSRSVEGRSQQPPARYPEPHAVLET